MNNKTYRILQKGKTIFELQELMVTNEDGYYPVFSFLKCFSWVTIGRYKTFSKAKLAKSQLLWRDDGEVVG